MLYRISYRLSNALGNESETKDALDHTCGVDYGSMISLRRRAHRERYSEAYRVPRSTENTIHSEQSDCFGFLLIRDFQEFYCAESSELGSSLGPVTHSEPCKQVGGNRKIRKTSQESPFLCAGT